MTITLSWWVIPAALVICAIVVPMFFPQKGDWDFFTPMIGLGLGIAFLVAAIAFTIGKLL